jgi:hypothetical protein
MTVSYRHLRQLSRMQQFEQQLYHPAGLVIAGGPPEGEGGAHAVMATVVGLAHPACSGSWSAVWGRKTDGRDSAAAEGTRYTSHLHSPA